MKINKRVLVIATYPIETPMHGGQKRTRAMVDYYRSIFSNVMFMSVFDKNSFTDSTQYSETDVAVTDQKILIDDFANDLLLGKSIYSAEQVNSRFKKMLLEYQPDIIQIEQIFPYAGISKLLNELNIKPTLILSSQNIEAELKESIYKTVDADPSKKTNYLAQITELEKRFTREADLVIAVSEYDARRHREMGAKKCVVARNGISKVTPSSAAIEHWQAFMGKTGVDKLVTFVASAHQPNWAGFDEMIGRDLSFLPEGTKLCLAGGVSNYLQSVEKSKSFWEKAQPLGYLSDDNLAGLIQVSEVIILPITSGGGSNLKTAEALLSNKKIVATEFAFRGYEEYLGSSNLYIANSRNTFQKSITKALRSPVTILRDDELMRREAVQWEYSLGKIEQVLSKLVESRTQTYSRKAVTALHTIGRKIKKQLPK